MKYINICGSYVTSSEEFKGDKYLHGKNAKLGKDRNKHDFTKIYPTD